MLEPEKALPFIRNDHIDEILLSTPEKLIECLVLHEIYHLKNHFRNVNELTPEERIANDFEADEWALKEMGLL
jgi:predicted metal-dependent hydrolase